MVNQANSTARLAVSVFFGLRGAATVVGIENVGIARPNVYYANAGD
jgi:hypothetical protein